LWCHEFTFVFKSSNSASKGENFKKIGYVITLGECFENKWFNMKYLFSVERLLTSECTTGIFNDLETIWINRSVTVYYWVRDCCLTPTPHLY
jgi:hypothetical protein